MLYKEPKTVKTQIQKRMWSSMKVLIAGELILFAGFSTFWVYLARSRDLRFKLYQKCPVILNGYYKFDEMFMHNHEKQRDYKAWDIKSE